MYKRQDTTIPLLAVIKPTESILVTSSYVNVPPIERLPDIVALVTCKVPIVPTPDTFRPVVTPVILTPLLKSTGVLNLSVDPAPVTFVNPDPSPTKLVAVTTPLELICLDAMSTTDILGVPVKP